MLPIVGVRSRGPLLIYHQTSKPDPLSLADAMLLSLDTLTLDQSAVNTAGNIVETLPAVYLRHEVRGSMVDLNNQTTDIRAVRV